MVEIQEPKSGIQWMLTVNNVDLRPLSSHYSYVPTKLNCSIPILVLAAYLISGVLWFHLQGCQKMNWKENNYYAS